MTANGNSSPRLAVVGGGIAGLTLAIGLQKQGVPYHLYEAAHHFGEIGAGVAFNPCAVSAFRLIAPELYEGFVRQMTLNATMKDNWFRFCWGMDSRGGQHKADDVISDYQGPGFALHSVHRAHFLDELVKLVPAEHVSFGKRLVREVDEGTHVRLDFHDGSSAVHSGVIGCDGIKSHVRESLLGPEYNARFTGKYAYRGVLPMDHAVELLGEDMARNSFMHLGYGGHILTFPIAHGATFNVVAFSTKPDGRWDDDRWVVPLHRADLERDFAHWGPTAKKILGLMEKPDVWALFEHPPAPTYCRNRVALVGAAAHASTPHQGSGAGMAVEDAYILSSLLGAARTDADLPDVFAVYDELRRVRSQKLVATSNEAGLQWELEHPAVSDDEDSFRRLLHSRLRWIWNHDLTAELAYGKQLFAERKTTKVALAVAV